MMQMIRPLPWLITLWILWTSLALPLSQPLCERIDKKGVLQLRDGDDLTDLCSCYELRELSYKKVNAVSLPSCLPAMESLRSVSFSKTNIQRLPNGLENFLMLEELDLSFTKLVYLPESIRNLYALKSLNLRGTEIVSLPDGLEHLETIDMRMIDLNRSDQENIRAQYPMVEIYFSSPCKCK